MIVLFVLRTTFTYRDYPDDEYSDSLWRGTHLKQKEEKEYEAHYIIIIELQDFMRCSRDSERPKFWRNADKDILEALW